MCPFPWRTILFFTSLILCVNAQENSIDLDFRPKEDNTMRSYLVEVASGITDRYMEGIEGLEKWETVRSERRQELIEMLGLVSVPIDSEREPPEMVETGRVEGDGFFIKKFYYESLPGLYVPANLYVPNELDGPAPAILYLCGHAREQMAAPKYQGNARKFAQLGFVCLVIETIQYGEVKGEHWGTYARGWFHWLSRGYHPGGVEVWNEIRAVDLLQSLAEVDADRIGATGPSGGGSQSWYLAALDERIACVAPVAGGETIEAEIVQRTVQEHCDCMMPHNIFERDFADIGSLIAPRPLLVAAPSRDGMFAIEAVREMHQQIHKVYQWYNAGDQIDMIEAVGGHGTREELRPRIFSFFTSHLMGKDIPAEQIGDIDMSEHASFGADELKVYTKERPDDNRTSTIQESFVTLASPPLLANEAEWTEYKNKVVSFLSDKTFNHFPDQLPDLKGRREYRAHDGAPYGREQFSFITEEGWRLRVDVRWRQPREQAQPLVLVLRNPEEERWSSEAFVRGLGPDVSVAYFSARGIGETGWASNQQWHIRRASAWTGRTIASMRVYDVMRCLEFLRTLPGVMDTGLSVAARGEMAAVATYAALMDGNLETVVLQDPPATQNQASNPDGSGLAIEMFYCLQVTDLPQVVGLLYPTKVFLSGTVPSSYRWAQELPGEVLEDGSLKLITNLADWQR